MRIVNTSDTCPLTNCIHTEACNFWAQRECIKFNADMIPEFCSAYTKTNKITNSKNEMLSRGKRKNNGEWIEGYYVLDESGQTAEEPIAYIYHLNKHPCGWNLVPFEVIPESVTRYADLIKHGEWDVKVGMNFYKERICSVCKEKIKSDHWNYCANCGAKNEGGVE